MNLLLEIPIVTGNSGCRRKRKEPHLSMSTLTAGIFFYEAGILNLGFSGGCQL